MVGVGTRIDLLLADSLATIKAWLEGDATARDEIEGRGTIMSANVRWDRGGSVHPGLGSLKFGQKKTMHQLRREGASETRLPNGRQAEALFFHCKRDCPVESCGARKERWATWNGQMWVE